MKKFSRTEYSLLNMVTGIVGYGVNTVVGFVCRILFVRILSAEYLGISGLFTNILSMLSLAELGISSAITFALYKPIAQEDENKIASIMQFYRKAYIVIGIIVAIAGMIIFPFLNVIITKKPDIKENINLIYLLFLFNTVISYFFSYRQSLLTAMQRQYIVTGYNYISTIIQSVLQIIFLVITKEYLVYLIIQIISGVLYNIWVSNKAAKDYPYIKNKNATKLSHNEKWDLFKNIKALAINKVSGVLVNSTDNIAITYFSGLSSVGFASNYTLFSSTIDKLITQLFNGLTGSVGNLNASSDDDTKYQFFKALNLSNFWLYGWAAIGIAVVSSDLVAWFYGKNYVMKVEIPLILALNFYSIGMLHAVYTYKSTLGLFRYGQYLLFFTGIINLILDVLLGRIWGIFGIYFATLVARILTNLWYEPYAVFRYGLKKSPLLYLKRYVAFLGILLATGGLCYFLCSFCNFSIITNVFVKIIICSIIPNGVFYICFRKTKGFLYLHDSLKRIFIKYMRKTR
ncbi:Membrane protein involved in the export of O-antigen and teichoic acid [Sharpea azabuensis]|uniref:lipopolysaccharide biosynthesis protein n=1 Tax=Sharpea azabuensis TaxID=322505 RepID=UPI0008EB82B7|nr:oligosaccharide flippase family protein [Sharpea azabuensis]SFD70949.1 Membrane protein involved in the export of O-antigen and teichoic acid [Sharpea azabuensis]SFK68323.1 Membrane protein involved in the export of O-antigen and teichoic acid [Sharpea azabuensis]